MDLVTNRDRFVEMVFKEPREFMNILDARNNEADNVSVTIANNGTIYNVYNDRYPTFYTTLGETDIIFDAFYTAAGTALVAGETVCYGKLYPTVTMADGLYFDLPVDAFSMLLNEAKAVASITLKQVPSPKAEQHSQTQRRRMSQEAWKIRNGITYPNYGRTGRK